MTTFAAIDTVFCRTLLAATHALVKRNAPAVNLRHDAWVWCAGRDHWEFHGPGDFYWHGRAGNAYHARHKGWMAWLAARGIEVEEIEDLDS